MRKDKKEKKDSKAAKPSSHRSSKKKRHRNEERSKKSSKKEKKHNSKRCQEGDLSMSEFRKDEKTATVTEQIDNDDFFRLSEEFRVWLNMTKKRFL